jgi:hypothetical protein
MGKDARREGDVTPRKCARLITLLIRRLPCYAQGQPSLSQCFGDRWIAGVGSDSASRTAMDISMRLTCHSIKLK